MAWTVEQAKVRTPTLTDVEAALWVQTANDALSACLLNKGTQADCEAQAIVLADGAVKNAQNSKPPAAEMTVVNFQAPPQAQVKHVMFDGRDHIVVPVVAVKAGVLNRKFASAEEISRFVDSWNGIPLPIGHPTARGMYVTANSIAILESQCVGRFFNAQFVNNKLKGDLYIDIVKATALGGDALLALNILERGEMLEVSTGYFADIIPQTGIEDGEEYDGVQVNLRPDHIALLPKDIGACSIAHGCGAGVHANHTGEKKSLWQRLVGSLKGALRVNMPQQSFDEIEQEVRDGLQVAEKIDPMSSEYLYLEEVYPDSVVYSIEGRGEGSVTYQRSYKMDTGGNPQFGDPQEVEREIRYVPVMAPTTNKATQRGDDAAHGGSDMDKKEKAAFLIANKEFPEMMRSTLEGTDNGVLTTLVANCEKRVAAENAAPEPVVQTQAQLPLIDADTLAYITNAKAEAQAVRKELEAVVVANADMTEAEVAGLSLVMLQKIAQKVQPMAVNFAGLGLPRTALLSTNGAPDIGLEPPTLPPVQ